MMSNDVVALDSITDIRAEHAGCIAVSGSHGGQFPAAVASRGGLRAVAFNDAGMGLENAGIAGLLALETVGMAGLAVSAKSAEIGSARDSIASGIVSFVNTVAADLGIVCGHALAPQIERLFKAPDPISTLPEVSEARWEEGLNGTPLLCVDSASLIRPEDFGRVIVTGSHGGLIGGDPARACKANARLVVFNDAGGGKNEVGFARLTALDQRGIAAVTLDCKTCRIGSAASGMETGVISRCNQAAETLGLKAGEQLIGHLELETKPRF